MRGHVLAAAMLVLCVESAHAQADDPDFAAWRDRFSQRAIAQGRTEHTLAALFEGVTPDADVLAIDRRTSSGYTPAIWDYLDAQVSEARITSGRTLLREAGPLLQPISAAYGVEPAIIVAVWGMESRYGAVDLRYDARRSLATLAYAGRPSRKAYFERQLGALAEMLESGHVRAGVVPASWDGGLGQAQFMPDSFLESAVDWDRDGLIDIWGNRGDVLASIAHYLQVHGYVAGAPTLIEARVDRRLSADVAESVRTTTQWESAGVHALEGPVNDASARLYRPAGAGGPAFLIYDNFAALKSYNGVQRYALAAAMLAHAIEGRPRALDWPRPADGLTREELMEFQGLLAANGYNAGNADGVMGERTWLAARAFAADVGVAPPNYPTKALLEALRARRTTP
ncbi:lytic murein transglycosylase [Terricaulis sp.]|uniref:lytic murein transglycosylase n=1 Tax=Terricaulis sp. TaxID=2768686 RepID=UPI0037843A83